jgi:ABC-type multidrug transport system ATPase subunit
MSAFIEAHGLTKHYKRVRALDGFDLVAEQGHVVALLGPNGAGKTTFVRAVATLTRPDAGTLRVAGVDAIASPAAVRRVIGLAGQYAAVEPAMTGRENLVMVGRLFGLSRHDARDASERVLRDFALDEQADRPVKTYSGGMRRRLDLGASMVGSPRLLLLDEPTTGLARAAASSCGRQFARSCRAAPTCCSPPSISTRPTSSRPMSSSSTTAGWLPRELPAT